MSHLSRLNEAHYLKGGARVPVGMVGNKYSQVSSAMSFQLLLQKISDASHLSVAGEHCAAESRRLGSILHEKK